MTATPADLAQRAQRARVPAEAAPGPAPAGTRPNTTRPPAHCPFRQRYEWAVMHSTLEPHLRLLALTIASRADYATGVIPPAAMPGIVTLGRATALGKTAVRLGLPCLEQAGFLHRIVADDGHHTVRLVLRLPGPGAAAPGGRP